MSCVLRVSGDHLDVDSLLSSVHLRPDNIWHRGEPRRRSKPNGRSREDSGVTFLASDADLSEFELQIEEATKYLEDHAGLIAGIVSFEGVQNAILDFGIELRDTAIHSDTLPPGFLRAACNAGIAVELSHYPCAEDAQQSVLKTEPDPGQRGV